MDRTLTTRQWADFGEMLTDQGWDVIAQQGDVLTIRQR